MATLEISQRLRRLPFSRPLNDSTGWGDLSRKGRKKGRERSIRLSILAVAPLKACYRICSVRCAASYRLEYNGREGEEVEVEF